MVRYRTHYIKQMDNGQQLRKLIDDANITQAHALELFNKRQARPLSLGHWKAFLAAPDSTRRSHCPDEVLARARKVIKPQFAEKGELEATR